MVQKRQQTYESRLPLSRKRKKAQKFRTMKLLNEIITEDKLVIEPTINDYVKAQSVFKFATQDLNVFLDGKQQKDQMTYEKRMRGIDKFLKWNIN